MIPGQVVYVNHGKAVVRRIRGVICEVEYETPNKVGHKEWVNMAKVETVVIKSEYRDKYTVDKDVRTPSGAHSISVGDPVAKALNGLSVDQLAGVAKDAGLSEKFKGWGHLNAGMQRMNLGNMLRSLVKSEEKGVAAAAAKAVSRAAKEEREYKPKVKAPRPKGKQPTQTKGKAAPAGKPAKKKLHRDEKVSKRTATGMEYGKDGKLHAVPPAQAEPTQAAASA